MCGLAGILNAIPPATDGSLDPVLIRRGWAPRILVSIDAADVTETVRS